MNKRTLLHFAAALLQLINAIALAVPPQLSNECWVHTWGTSTRLHVYCAHIYWLVPVFCLLSCVNHSFVVLASGCSGWTRAEMDAAVRRARWLEYSVSAGCMTWVIAVMSGQRDLGVLAALAVLNVVLQSQGWLLDTMLLEPPLELLMGGQRFSREPREQEHREQLSLMGGQRFSREPREQEPGNQRLLMGGQRYTREPGEPEPGHQHLAKWNAPRTLVMDGHTYTYRPYTGQQLGIPALTYVPHSHTTWAVLLQGFGVFLAAWVVIVSQFFASVTLSEKSVPAIVYAIVWVLFFFYSCFGLVPLLLYTKSWGVTKDNYEHVYTLLSLCSKTALAWMVARGAARGDEWVAAAGVHVY